MGTIAHEVRSIVFVMAAIFLVNQAGKGPGILENVGSVEERRETAAPA